MSRVERRLYLLSSVFLLFAIAAAVFELHGRGLARAGRAAANAVFRLPYTVGEWRGRELPVDENVREVLETRSVLMREYRRGGEAVLLTVVHYPDARVALHLPESCYAGQGSHIVSRDTEEMGGFRANRFRISGNKGNKIVLYYFETGNFRTHSYGMMRLRMVLNRLSGKGTGCALVRFTRVRSGNDAQALSRDEVVLGSFVRAMNGVLPEYLP